MNALKDNILPTPKKANPDLSILIFISFFNTYPYSIYEFFNFI